MTELVYAEAAERDLTEIALRIANDDPGAAFRFVEDIRHHCGLLVGVTLMGRARRDLHPDIRSFPHRSYVVYYMLKDDQVRILRVWHGRRRTPSVTDLL